jgi:PAS domain S-box-containing protein
MKGNHQNENVTGCKTRMEQAEARTDQAEIRTEQAIHTSELSYRRLFEAAKDGILILDVDTGRINDVNPFLFNLLGFSRSEMIGKTVGELSPFKDIESNKVLLERLQKDGYVRYENLPLETRDGRKIAVEFVSNVYQAGDKKVIRCNVRDITERKHAEEVLRASEVSYRRLFEAAKDGILILEADTGRISDINPFLVEMLGFSRSELVGKTIWEISPFKDIVANKDRFAQLQQQGYVRYDNLPLETRDGRQIAVEFVSNMYPAGDRNVIQCNIRDITTRKRAEEQLKASFKEVGELNTEIQNFYHTLSHELKTPLTSAREFVSIVMDGLAGPLNKTQLEYLGIAKESCDQLRLYINDLLDVTRLETGKMSIKFQALPLAALVERVVEMLAPAAAGKGVSLSCDCQPDLPAVPIDKQRILQVLTNLTTNAIKFTPAGGHIRLSLGEAPADPECLQVTVRDTGRGIPKDHLDMIFNRLYQANYNAQSGESRNGLGLGLYICQELVELHGGRIWVESEIEKGSTFSFALPKQGMTKGPHVLIVDDDHAIRETLRLLLEEQHFRVATAEGGSEALELMGKKIPDIVVLDLMMTELDGPGTLKEIRRNWGLVPVLVYTGYPDGNLMRQAMDSSPFTFLAKPCPPNQFVETVRRMCHTHETRFVKKNGKAGPAPAAQSARNHFTSEDPAPHPQLNS